jgi:site-specific DNA recombinase
MKVVGYIRVSTDRQDESGLGLEAQQHKIRTYCDLYDLELICIHKDAASGKNLRRSGLESALHDLESGKAEGIMVAKLDRLTRSVRDLGSLLDRYFSNRFQLAVVEEQVDTRTAAGRLTLNLLVSVAQWERETTGERTKAALQAKRARGEKTGGYVPYGYTVTHDGKLIADEAEQRIIAYIHTLAEGGVNCRQIALKLNAAGHRTKRGSSWYNVQVSRILAREAA